MLEGIFILIIVIFLGMLAAYSDQNPRKPHRPYGDESYKKRLKANIIKPTAPSIDSINIDTIDGHAFETYVGDLLKKQGFWDVEVTQGSGDFGVDIFARKNNVLYAIQTKRQKSKLSRKAISDAVAGKQHYGCDAAMVVTNSYLSEHAKMFANSLNCQVIDRDRLKKWIQTAEDPKPNNNNTIANETKTSYKETDSHLTQLQPMELDMSTIDSSGVPNDIINGIKKQAASEYPEDYGMQLSIIEEELEAYKKIGNLKFPDIPEEVFSYIKKKAASEYPKDYGMQLSIIEEELEAYKKIQEI